MQMHKMTGFVFYKKKKKYGKKRIILIYLEINFLKEIVYRIIFFVTKDDHMLLI